MVGGLAQFTAAMWRTRLAMGSPATGVVASENMVPAIGYAER
jgi:hypothetical protein